MTKKYIFTFNENEHFFPSLHCDHHSPFWWFILMIELADIFMLYLEGPNCKQNGIICNIWRVWAM